MLDFLKNLFGDDKKRYEAQKAKLTSADAAARLALAEASDTHPEILFYLAKDKEPSIRRAVAVNKVTPVQASALLANDKSDDVRLALAARLVELLPDLSADEHSQLYAYAVQALGTLAQDEVLKIRRALSSALKDHAKAPPKVAGQLARDVEREVSEPVLRACIALSDDDLLNILGGHPESWVVSAIASRPTVSEKVADAVFETGDVPGNTILINNSGAAFSQETLQKIIEKSREFPEWHGPIAMRKELSMNLARQLSGFVNETVLSLLERREDFDPDTRKEVVALVKRRIEYKSQQTPNETPEARLQRLVKTGKLSPELVHDALVWQDDKFVILALSQMSGIHPRIAEKMLRVGSAKPVMALCYKAKIPMRVCVDIQRDLAKLHPEELVYAKGGTDYPLTPPEIKWQLEFYGVTG